MSAGTRRRLVTAVAVVGLAAGIGSAPAQAGPITVLPVADSDTGSASGSALVAWPLGFLMFAACFADGDSPVHNPLCQAVLDLTSGST
ncbi:twin-arginine translocation signal domain-containing protein [Nocardia neocaledoniensis]|uniref:twin-arginine translocation signal domain-containing protein n=1 Tax=Nocardia neocaledoniensis TaxID=236511 RepID=UPI002458227F|nr:twin-arginine translocation signal domain-containing protein [Nocardia neocaledoniensis]